MLKFCRNCGQELTLAPDKTCVRCGKKPTKATLFCRYCGKPTTSNDPVCPSCGAAIRPVANLARLLTGKNQKLVRLGIAVNLVIVVTLISAYVVLSLPRWLTRQIKSVASDVVMQTTGYNGLPLSTISAAPPSIPEADGPRRALHAVMEDFTPEGVAPGTGTQLSVYAVYKSVTGEDITNHVIYQSENELVANVTASGLVTAVAPGRTTINIYYTAVPGSSNLSNPSAGKIPVTLNTTVSVIVE